MSLSNSKDERDSHVDAFLGNVSFRFVLPYPRDRIKSVAQGCKNLPPVAI